VRVAAYYPYGEYEGTASGDDVRFATYVRDSATGLDYAVNRYYSSIIGRFMTPDPSRTSVDQRSPQSWNRYAYVHNDPVNFYDPDGTFLRVPDPSAEPPNARADFSQGLCVFNPRACDPFLVGYGGGLFVPPADDTLLESRREALDRKILSQRRRESRGWSHCENGLLGVVWITVGRFNCGAGASGNGAWN
jgi:RHS repeat-associated protein